MTYANLTDAQVRALNTRLNIRFNADQKLAIVAALDAVLGDQAVLIDDLEQRVYALENPA